MSLQFIGESGVYLPNRDAIRVTAIAGDSVVDCYVTRSALEAIGCTATDPAGNLAGKFEARRLDCEIAAMVKFRRATTKLLSIEITAADLAMLERSHAA